MPRYSLRFCTQLAWIILFCLTRPVRAQQPSASGANNTLSPSESAAGWILLFDGRTLSGYEANIFDAHEAWPTGSINNVQSVNPNRLNTTEKWNTLELTADGSHLIVNVNGKATWMPETRGWPAGRSDCRRAARTRLV